MKNLLCYAIMLSVFGCSVNQRAITNPEDYQKYLGVTVSVNDKSIEQEMSFWQTRWENMPGDDASVLKLAGLYSRRFKNNGIISDITMSDSLYSSVLQKDSSQVEILQALAANSIAQHEFTKAQDYAEKAITIGNKKAASLFLLADTYLERGDAFRASLILNGFKNKNSFAYLIRQAKVKDQEGRLDTAILLMEKAHTRVIENDELSQWTLSNLGDMYGHAGRIEDAYHAYLSVLKNNPSDHYALKGISWILLSHERDTKAAKAIIEVLSSRQRMPEAHLMLAEIADMEGDQNQKRFHLNTFMAMATESGYKKMYNKYLATLFLDELDRADLALAIADEEILNRPTPQSYDLKAWSYYHQKAYADALEIVQSKIEGESYEPELLYHAGMIYLANGKKERAEEFLSEALKAQFELGPGITRNIRQALSTL